jgi:ABC-type multidrug transport system fused ATPase/permease subunit
VIRFLRRLWPLLPPSERPRLRRTASGAVLLALLDACGVGLVLPLVQLATAEQGAVPGGAAGWVGDVTGVHDTGRLALGIAVTIVVVFVGKGLLALWLLRTNVNTALACETAMADRLVRGYLAAPLTFHLGRNSAELQRTLHESLRRVYQEGLATAVPAIGDRVILGAVGVVLVAVAPLEALVGGLWFAALLALYRRLTGARVGASSTALVEEGRQAIQQVQQALASVREVTVSGRADSVTASILDLRERAAQRLRVITLTEQLPRYYLEIGLVGGAAVVSAVAFALREAGDALAILALFVAAGLRVLPSMNRSIYAQGKARVAMPNLAVIEADLAATPDPDAAAQADPDPLPGGEPFGELLMSDVGFAYPGRAPVLRGLNLRVAPGESIGIVGGSGAGKSTLVGLVLGLLDPTEGAISVNGRPMAACRRSWQQRVGYVPQTVAVLDASVRENVAFGCPEHEIDDERVLSAIAAARLDGFLAGLPDGLATDLGEDGARLSGGQRQRLGLARALYDQPELLVLDEATSSLDGDTEQRILQTLEQLRGRITMVVVAHRHSTIRATDRVVHLAEGGVRSEGSYRELLTSDAAFAHLAQLDDASR